MYYTPNKSSHKSTVLHHTPNHPPYGRPGTHSVFVLEKLLLLLTFMIRSLVDDLSCKWPLFTNIFINR